MGVSKSTFEKVARETFNTFSDFSLVAYTKVTTASLYNSLTDSYTDSVSDINFYQYIKALINFKPEFPDVLSHEISLFKIKTTQELADVLQPNMLIYASDKNYTKSPTAIISDIEYAQAKIKKQDVLHLSNVTDVASGLYVSLIKKQPSDTTKSLKKLHINIYKILEKKVYLESSTDTILDVFVTGVTNAGDN